jgi:CheY-like chemotaxis protein
MRVPSRLELLLVEDAIHHMRLARHSIWSRFPDCSITWLEQGEKVINLPDVERYTLILLDYQLPGMSGRDVLLHLRGTGRFIGPILIISAVDLKEGAMSLVEAGASGIARKDHHFYSVLPELILSVLEKEACLRWCAEHSASLGRIRMPLPPGGNCVVVTTPDCVMIACAGLASDFPGKGRGRAGKLCRLLQLSEESCGLCAPGEIIRGGRSGFARMLLPGCAQAQLLWIHPLPTDDAPPRSMIFWLSPRVREQRGLVSSSYMI